MSDPIFEIPQKKAKIVEEIEKKVSSNISIDISSDDEKIVMECHPNVSSEIRNILDRNNEQIIKKINELIIDGSNKKKSYVKIFNETYNFLMNTFKECFEKNGKILKIVISGMVDGSAQSDSDPIHHWNIFNKEKAHAINFFLKELRNKGYHPERRVKYGSFVTNYSRSAHMVLKCNLY
ncbi:MAG: hypothetical protein Satyrvirus2_26 [Satyrvirus sp.]|uniref:Uncharacterized protein n=1 Tax=Satyrvirus sp. TaxID=2487771 RepID=A0A3G5ACQ8_9VIRU|nr:MAG: hypothetical protein Satyrvirus2_26 [Satyrvirus sp.]